MIYLDNAATSFHRPPEVEQAIVRALHDIGNAGRGAHAPTLNASRLLYDTREKLAALLGAEDASRIAFTCNATEALNIAIQGSLSAGDHVITTMCEHNSVLRPLYLMEEKGVELTVLPADDKGRLDYSDFERYLRTNTKAVVITHASNLSGNVTDMERVSAFTEKHRLRLIVDAAQTAGCLPIDVAKMHIDILCFTGHKGLMGPQGTGGIYVRSGVEVKPLKAGGSGVHSFDKKHPAVMPTALEAGTLNGHGIAGLNGALDFIARIGVEEIHRKETALARRFAEGVRQVAGVRLYGNLTAGQRTAIVSLNIGDMDSSAVCDILWEDYGICVRGGAHCAPLMHQAFDTVHQGAVRFSFSYFNTEDEVEQAICAVREIAEG